jgi:hypothetical protein
MDMGPVSAAATRIAACLASRGRPNCSRGPYVDAELLDQILREQNDSLLMSIWAGVVSDPNSGLRFQAGCMGQVRFNAQCL